jgi:excisionase family DNA binding protein
MATKRRAKVTRQQIKSLTATAADGREGFSIAEVARLYGVSEGLIRLEIDRKRLKSGRIGRPVILLRPDLQEWLRR